LLKGQACRRSWNQTVNQVVTALAKLAATTLELPFRLMFAAANRLSTVA